MPAPGPAVGVDVWTAAACDLAPERLLHLLDPDELRRARSLTPGAARGFVIGRALLRAALGPMLGMGPAAVPLTAVCEVCGAGHGQVRLAVNPDGSPTTNRPGRSLTDEQRGAQPDLHVSVSRSSPLVAVAVSSNGPVGVDVETYAAVGAAPVAGVALSEAELAALRRLPASGRTAAIAGAWVRKESVLKALGCGVRSDPAAVAVLRRPQPFRWSRTALADRWAGFELIALPLASTLVGAVAVGRDPAGQRLARRPAAVRLHDGVPALRHLERRATTPA